MIRAVLDANVFVSAVLNPRGIPAKVLDAWRAEQFHLVLSEAILDEIARVFRYPKIARRHRWPEARIQAFVDELAHLALVTPGLLKLTLLPEDPANNRYLECAVEGEAEYLVSGDRHLLRVGEYLGTRIATPKEFFSSLRKPAKP